MSLYESRKNTLIHIIILVIPFLFFHWMIPFISDVTIGSDYPVFSLRWQMELLFSIKSGSFPLYVPGFASGQSSSALTLAQIFHPLPYLASIMPGYWNGKAIEWNNFFKLLSLGLAHLALFSFLRSARISKLFAFLFSLIAVYNLRTIDMFHYGASLEAYTAYLVLCAAIGWYFINPTKRLGPVCIVGTAYLLISSGYPHMMYFGFIGAGLFALIAPFILSTLLPEKQVDFKIVLKYWLKVCLYLSLGIMLSSAYILPFYFDFMSVNVDRVGQNYQWSLENVDTAIGTVNNFFLPLRSEAHSAFGGSSLVLMAAMLPMLRLFKVKIPRSIWAIWGILLIIILYMLAGRTPIHRLAWEYLPFASNVRVPGRISMIMPIFMLMLLAWIVKEDSSSISMSRLSVTVKLSTMLTCITFLMIAIYYLLYVTGYYIFSFPIFKELFPHYPAGYFLNIPFFWVELIVIISGLVSLIALFIYSLNTGAARVMGILLIIMTAMQLGIVSQYRSALWVEKKYDFPTFEEMQKQKKTKLDYLYYSGGGMHSSIVIKQLKRSFIEPFLGKIFTHVVPVDSQETSYKRMRLNRLPQQLFIEGYNPEKAKTITEGAKDMREGIVKLIYSSFNRMQFHVDSQAPAFFGLSYPYTGHWKAWVNGKEVRIYRANGAAHAVEIPEGENLVEFRYWSNAFFWGMLISCTTFVLIGLFVCFSAMKGLTRSVGVIIILIISAGGFTLWYNSLYSGDNLKTEYTWTYTPPLEPHNLAYGKENWLGSSVTSLYQNIDYADWHYRQQLLYVSRFIDGNRSRESGFSTPYLIDNPGWFLDLSHSERIKSIVLFEGGQIPSSVSGEYSALADINQLINVRPLQIALSNDGINWSTVISVVSQIKLDGPTRIVYERPQTARFIRIKTSGKSILSFDEVEIYGP